MLAFAERVIMLTRRIVRSRGAPSAAQILLDAWISWRRESSFGLVNVERDRVVRVFFERPFMESERL